MPPTIKIDLQGEPAAAETNDAINRPVRMMGVVKDKT